MPQCGDCTHYLFPPEDFNGRADMGYCLECDDWCWEKLETCKAFEDVKPE